MNTTEVCVRGKERHLALRVATVGAVRVSLDKLAYDQVVRGFFRGDGACLLMSWFPRFS
jgi:hypothetical protein